MKGSTNRKIKSTILSNFCTSAFFQAFVISIESLQMKNRVDHVIRRHTCTLCAPIFTKKNRTHLKRNLLSREYSLQNQSKYTPENDSLCSLFQLNQSYKVFENILQTTSSESQLSSLATKKRSVNQEKYLVEQTILPGLYSV